MVLLLAAGGWVLHLYVIAGEFKDLTPHFDGTCTRVEGVVGAEDITFRPDGLVAYVSSDDRRASLAGDPRPGAIFAYHLGPEGGELHNLTPDASADFHPHGIGLHTAPGSPDRLFVVNHPRNQSGAAHAIEIFDVDDDRLVHQRTLLDELLVSPNDIVPVGRERFYVTNDHGSASAFGQKLEDYLRLGRSNILYFDGAGFVEVATEFRYANGINVSADGGRVYLAATTDRAVFVFARNPEDGTLEQRGEVFLDTGVDNIEVDEEGNLWIGCHPKLLTFVSHSKDAANRAPSQVLKLVPDGQSGFNKEEIFLSLGDDLSASSVAARVGDRLLIGGVFDPVLLDCRMK